MLDPEIFARFHAHCAERETRLRALVEEPSRVSKELLEASARELHDLAGEARLLGLDALGQVAGRLSEALRTRVSAASAAAACQLGIELNWHAIAAAKAQRDIDANQRREVLTRIENME